MSYSDSLARLRELKAAAKGAPTKPTKQGCDGFVGAVEGECPKKTGGGEYSIAEVDDDSGLFDNQRNNVGESRSWRANKTHKTAAVESGAVPLATKLRTLGRPWPLVVDGKVKCWLVADAAAAKQLDADECVYTATEVEYLSKLLASDVQYLHAIKSRLGGTIGASEDEEN